MSQKVFPIIIPFEKKDMFEIELEKIIAQKFPTYAINNFFRNFKLLNNDNKEIITWSSEPTLPDSIKKLFDSFLRETDEKIKQF
jgi:hypothetical protein